jgi:hypothetical protein
LLEAALAWYRRLLNTFREAGTAIGVALFGVLILDSPVTGIETAIILSGLLLVMASGIAVISIGR